MPQPRTDEQLAAALDDAFPPSNEELRAALSNRAFVLATVWQPTKPPKPRPPKQRKSKKKKPKKRSSRPETQRERLYRERRESVRAKVALIREHQAEWQREQDRLEWREHRYNRMMDAFAAARFAREQAHEYNVTCAGINDRLRPVADDLAYDGWAALGRPPTEDC